MIYFVLFGVTSLCLLVCVVALVMHGSGTKSRENKAVNHNAIIASCVGKSTSQCDALMKDVPYSYIFVERTNTPEFKYMYSRSEEKEADIRFFLHKGLVEFYMTSK